MTRKLRVRFAPSPTGALHIGGVRTALYNYLLAKQQGGDFILRIEDTDQGRYVEGAEQYIIEALLWCGIVPDESPQHGGAFGPYRQSDRKEIYKQYAEQLVASGNAYYAFDTTEALQAKRDAMEAEGKTFKYDDSIRLEMDNSLVISKKELQKRLKSGEPYTIRLKVPSNETVTIQDRIRGKVALSSNELDDRVLMKADGMPTYHLANIVDDHLMEITHVIRGEEWLSSTAHHVLLYRFLGWEATMPEFAHLPLILKPVGQGKLSKRDGAKFGFPVFPLSWKGETEEDSFVGFREAGFLPEALINFLAFLGWNPGTEQEIFSMEELIAAFDIAKIGKSGSRFNIEKATWYNQQYMAVADNDYLAYLIQPLAKEKGYTTDLAFLSAFCGLMKGRVAKTTELLEKGIYFFEPVQSYDEKTIQKKWKADARPQFDALVAVIAKTDPFDAATLESQVKGLIHEQNLKMGDILQVFRISIAGTLKGPDLFQMAALLGKTEVLARFKTAYAHFDTL